MVFILSSFFSLLLVVVEGNFKIIVKLIYVVVFVYVFFLDFILYLTFDLLVGLFHLVFYSLLVVELLLSFK